MNKYLLLRDNKQSGPYSVDELAVHGLKAYDLVWLEGKSAAWRYPSEIAELKPFAPVVEEQPFDRFYKKPEIKTFEQAVKDNTRVNKNTPYNQEIKKPDIVSSPETRVELKNNSGKKIHVSLPTKAVESFTKPAQEELHADSLPVTPPQPPVENIKPIPQAVVVDESISNSNKKIDVAVDSKPNFEAAYRKSKQKESTASTPPVKEAPVSKLLFRTVTAACLLLGGALIGLVINYNSQQKKFQQLNQLVQEIKHQENPGAAKAAKKNESISEEAKPKIEEPIVPQEETVYKEDIQLPPAKKDRTTKKTIERGATTPDTQLNQPPVVPAIRNEEPVEKPDKQSSELAKKNLWQLVTVDHNTYKTGVFGGVSNLSLKLSNKSLFQLEQVEVEVLFLSPENKTVNKQKVIFENVSPGEQLTVNVPKSNRGVKVNYSIRLINTKEFGLAHAGM